MSGWRSYHISSATDSGQSYGIPAGEGHDIVILSGAKKKIINCHSERSEESAGEDNNNND